MNNFCIFVVVSLLALTNVIHASALHPQKHKVMSNLSPNDVPLVSSSSSNYKSKLMNTLLPSVSMFSALLLTSTAKSVIADDGKLEYQPALTGLGYGKVCNTINLY